MSTQKNRSSNFGLQSDTATIRVPCRPRDRRVRVLFFPGFSAANFMWSMRLHNDEREESALMRYLFHAPLLEKLDRQAGRSSSRSRSHRLKNLSVALALQKNMASSNMVLLEDDLDWRCVTSRHHRGSEVEEKHMMKRQSSVALSVSICEHILCRLSVPHRAGTQCGLFFESVVELNMGGFF